MAMSHTEIVQLEATLREEIKVLRAALEPFANISLLQDEPGRGTEDCIDAPDLSITPNHVRAARAALES